MSAVLVRIGFAALAITLAFGAAAANDGAKDAPPAAEVTPPSDQQPLPPIVHFSRSNSGWSANISFADPVVEIQWSLKRNGPFESTGFLPSYDPLTRKPMANPALDIDENMSVIYVRYADLKGNWIGPFAVPFDPEAEITRFYRSILETTTNSWLSFRHDAPKILYYTHISSYRCAIREFRVGIERETPNRVVPLAACNMRDPVSTPSNTDTHLMIDPNVNFVSAQIVYRDGTVSKVRTFRR